MDAFSIIRDAEQGLGYGITVLGLVDRKLSDRLWWTSDAPSLLLCYRKRSAAEFALRRLSHGNPRIIPYKKAFALLWNQSERIDEAKQAQMHSDACAAMEAGWDGHK